ncbi:carbohydrate ABC transporter permease [Paenibacillus thalictri]|uniref:Sugar ABC transporter permease n=1 Tax=Paenibacillus thalictri TaxID=2527873 RepID=A0A4Q9DEX0_9BACL|nr:sugar ABC transporter permease [Paenibacillus thalictri]TBL70317.1 sugar ABC transporter permease [Paenibacillus thalictri]
MKSKHAQPVLFLLPALLIYLTVIVSTSIYSLYLSVFRWNGVNSQKAFVGIQNYADLFTKDAIFISALKNNFLWVAGSLLFTMTFSLLIAVVLNRQFRGRVFFRSVFYFPYILSGIVVSLMWSWLYHPTMGFFNDLLTRLGFETLDWLADPKLALGSVFVASLWHSLGAPMVLFMAGLQSIPQDPYECAKVEGANALQSFFYITIPLLKETFVIVFATTLIGAMKVFDTIYAMTGGGPAQKTQVLASWMYFQTFQFNNLGMGTAISWVLVIIVMLITIPYVLHMSKNSHV